MHKHMYQDEVSMKFLRSLKAERQKLKMTQKDLSIKIGRDKRSISRYERGCALPTLDILMKLAVIFGCDLSSSLNYRYYHGEIKSETIKRNLADYGLTCQEVGRLTGRGEETVRRAANLGSHSSLECLSLVLDVIDAERKAEKFRRKLLAR